MTDFLNKAEHKLKEMTEKRHFPTILPFLSAFLCILIFLAILAALDILGIGNNTILRSDLNSQYICFIQQFIRVLKGEESFWYSFTGNFGSGSILTHAYYTLNPFNLLYLIETVPIPTMTAVIIVLKFSLSAACFQLFIQKVLKQEKLYTVVFSLSYALCGYAVSMHHNIMWLDALYLLPVIMILTFRLVNTGKALLLIPAFVYLFLTNFYMAYMVGIFTVIVFFAYSCYRLNPHESSSRKQFLKHTLSFCGCGILSAGLCAAILLPAALFLFGNMAADNFEFKELTATIPDMINAMFAGEMQTIDTKVPLLYCGLPVLGLLPFYFLNKKITKKEKIYIGAVITFLIVSMTFLPLYKLMHAFDYPNYYGYRFAYLLVFLFLSAACRQASFIREISIRSLGLYCLLLCAFYSLMIPLQKTVYYNLNTNTQEELLLNAAFLLIWFLLAALLQKSPAFSSLLSAAAIFIMAAELTANGYLCIHKVEHRAIDESVYNQWYYSSREALDNMQERDDDFYRIHFNNSFNYNSASFFGFAGLTTFSSSDNYNLRNALFHLGLTTSNRYISEQGMTEIMDMLLAVKYDIDLTKAEADTGITASDFTSAAVTENPYALSLGYMVSPMIEQYETTEDPFYNQEFLLCAMTGKSYLPFEPIVMDDISIEYDNMGIAYNVASVEFYPLSDTYGGGHISFSAPTREDRRFMMCFTRTEPKALVESAQLIDFPQGVTDASTLSYGAIHQGVTTDRMYDDNYDMIVLEFTDNTTTTDYCNNIYAYYYNSALLPSIYEDLAQGNMTVTSHGKDTVIGTVTATADRPVLFTSIPYEKGWEAYVDGVPAQTFPVVEDAFLALVLTPGEHTIELHYTAPGSEAGFLISSISLILLLLVLLISKKRAKIN